MCDSEQWYCVLPFGWVAPFLIPSIQLFWFTSQVFHNYFPNCLFIHSTIITRPWEYSCKHDGWGICSHREGLYTNICEQIITERERAKKKINVMGLHVTRGLPRGIQKAHSEELICEWWEWWEVSHARIWDRRCRFDPWVRKIPWRRAWQPTPVFLPGKSHGQRCLAGFSPGCCKLSNMTEQLSKSITVKRKSKDKGCGAGLCLASSGAKTDDHHGESGKSDRK